MIFLSEGTKALNLIPLFPVRFNGNIYKDEAKIAELERKIGQLYIENEFLKKALKTLEVRIVEEKKKSINRRNI